MQTRARVQQGHQLLLVDEGLADERLAGWPTTESLYLPQQQQTADQQLLTSGWLDSLARTVTLFNSKLQL